MGQAYAGQPLVEYDYWQDVKLAAALLFSRFSCASPGLGRPDVVSVRGINARGRRVEEGKWSVVSCL
jgi:hypothetical protein